MADPWVRIDSARRLGDASLMRSALEREGIEVELRGEHLPSIAGELPLNEAEIELLVRAGDAEKARRVLAEFRAPKVEGPPRACPKCGEDNPSNFEVCWKCHWPIAGDAQFPVPTPPNETPPPRAEEALSSPRKAWLAALLAFLSPGLGHLYCGKMRAAILWALAIPVTLTVLLCTGALLPGALVALTWLALIVSLCLWGGHVVAAARLARKSGPFRPHRYNRWWVYALFFVVAVFARKLITSSLRDPFVEPFRLPSESMLPTIQQGDQFLVLKAGPGSRWEVGDVIVFQRPEKEFRHLKYVKRVIARGGDTVELRGDLVFVNGAAIPQDNIECPAGTGDNKTCHEERAPSGKRWSIQSDPWRDENTPPVTVPPESVYVLGDLRHDSLDSRHFGVVREQDVIGRAHAVWISFGEGMVPQPSRFGLKL